MHWDRPHCGVRLVEAFKTLSRMPEQRGPRFKSGYWAPYPMEWIDIVAKEHEYLNDPGQAREAAQQRARTRHRCTPEEVSRMETALTWTARYLHHRPLVARLVQSVAQLRSIVSKVIGSPGACTSPRRWFGVPTVPGLMPLLPGFVVMAWRCFELLKENALIDV